MALALLGCLEALAREQGLAGVRLLARADNAAAQALYQVAGYRQSDTLFCEKRVAGLRCPVYCVWGDHGDVVPLAESVERMRQALVLSTHPAHALDVVPGATHMLYTASPAPHGLPAEAMHARLHNVTFAAGVRGRVAEWAGENVRKSVSG